jgi:hypothetical protein
MIPLQYPLSDFDYAEDHDMANWTSYPEYSYSQFSRSNPGLAPSPFIGTAKPYRQPENAGPYLPDMFPYGQGGRPATYAVKNGREEADAIIMSAMQGIFGTLRDAPSGVKEKVIVQATARHTGLSQKQVRTIVASLVKQGYLTRSKSGVLRFVFPASPQAEQNRGRERKYQDVLDEHGESGFAFPEKAPYVGSFPLYPVTRARYALAIVTAPAYDNKPSQRRQVMDAVIEAYAGTKHAAALRRQVDEAREKIRQRTHRR